MNIVKEAAWTISNITAGNSTQIQVGIIWPRWRLEMLKNGTKFMILMHILTVIFYDLLQVVVDAGVLQPLIDILVKVQIGLRMNRRDQL